MTENNTVRAISEWPVNGLTGRRKIYTAKKKVTPENVVEVLGKALAVHRINSAEMSYLYDYYRGKQDIRLKDKIVRPEINNKVMINRANEIVVFKSAYLLDGPIRYVSNGGEDDISRGDNPFVIGNIYTGVVDETRRRLMQKYDSAQVEGDGCDECPLNRICDGGCVANNYIRSGSFHHMPPICCRWNRLLFREAIYLMERLGKARNKRFLERWHIYVAR